MFLCVTKSSLVYNITNLLLLAITDEQRFIRVDKDNGRHFGIIGNEITELCNATLPNVPVRKYKHYELHQFDTYSVKMVKSNGNEYVMRIVDDELSASVYEMTADYILQPVVGR